MFIWMDDPSNLMQINKNPRTIALISILAGLCLAIQLAPRPPNVEFTSVLAFMVGFMFGSILGMLFGGFVMFVNGFFSPWGFAGLNMPFQMAGMSLVGLAGGVYKGFSGVPSMGRFCVEASVFGAFLAVIYDFITNLGVALTAMVSGISPNPAIITAFAYGAPFSLIHVASNIAVFGAVFSPLAKTLNQIPWVRDLG
jgi:hypothetical protein